jgi:hypothetical protein
MGIRKVGGDGHGTPCLGAVAAGQTDGDDLAAGARPLGQRAGHRELLVVGVRVVADAQHGADHQQGAKVPKVK